MGRATLSAGAGTLHMGAPDSRVVGDAECPCKDEAAQAQEDQLWPWAPQQQNPEPCPLKSARLTTDKANSGVLTFDPRTGQ